MDIALTNCSSSFFVLTRHLIQKKTKIICKINKTTTFSCGQIGPHSANKLYRILEPKVFFLMSSFCFLWEECMDRNMHFDSPMTLYSIVHDIVGFVLIVIDVCTKININSQHSQAELPPRLYHLVLSCMSYQLYVYRPNISFDHHRNSQNAIHQRNRRTFSYFGSNSNRNGTIAVVTCMRHCCMGLWWPIASFFSWVSDWLVSFFNRHHNCKHILEHE